MRKHLLLSILIGFVSITGQGRGATIEKVRKPVVAGMFYPADPRELRRVLHGHIGNVEREHIDGKIVALISPHAGYMYSGLVAAHVYKLVEGMNLDDVVVIAPSHRFDFSGASIYDGEGYETPLGIVPIDRELSRRMSQQSRIIDYIPQAHAQEHSLEVQVPFLQTVLKGFSLLPMVMGPTWNSNVCKQLSQAIIRSIKGKRALIIASSDLTHSYNYQQVVAQDKILARYIDEFDIDGLAEDLRQGRCQACGGGPILVAMMVAQGLGANRGKVLKLTNSGDITGKKTPGNYVVGYMAAVLYQVAEKLSKGLTEEEKRLLHHIARMAIEDMARGKPVPGFTVESQALMEKKGAFVTLKKGGQLRGCIGHIKGGNPLYKIVGELAAAAAFHDPRFKPVTEAELPDLEIEISVLTPLRLIDDVGEIQVGRDGIYLKKGDYSGLLLPQVATEYGWDRMTFLEHTCIKAGLPIDAWKDGDTWIYIFSAEVF
ncbi:MAG: AmmeMemoRadiSam system protein B [Syntrophobacterales bacterium]|nr:MAG: AmmeMemoRadiSam system protein B [Syntrophobacterales bacterium]